MKRVYETDAGHVMQISKGWYAVYQNTGVVAERVATVHYPKRPEYALARAKQILDNEVAA